MSNTPFIQAKTNGHIKTEQLSAHIMEDASLKTNQRNYLLSVAIFFATVLPGSY